MSDNSFEDKVRGVDWAKYLEPEYYDPKRMDYRPDRTIKALIQLSRCSDLKAETAENLGTDVRFAIGNDHRGTYYPAAIEAIDLLIDIEKNSDLEAARRYAADILTDLYYFELELGSKDEQLYAAIEKTIREKLQPYADEI